MKPYRFLIEGDMPEHVSVVFETSGWKGGDAGHGGYTSVTFTADGCKGQTVLVAGDWESTGLVLALIRLGRMLEQAYVTPVAFMRAECADENYTV